jgi:hypothetical protein
MPNNSVSRRALTAALARCRRCDTTAMTEESVELVRRRKSQAPPARLMWQAIANPESTESRGWPWFEPLADEQVPAIVEIDEPRRVVWGSIWRDRPDLRVVFEIEPHYGDDRYGCTVTWILRGPEGALNAEDLERRRYRMNQLINGILRDYFDL